MSFLESLNAPQREAVLHDAGPLVVFAGAGSGKTRVITFRVARLVAELAVPPWRILCVTFTNKAAGEMKERLTRLVPQGGARDIWVGTFHAICARLLRRHHEQIGVRRDFTIYDDSDQKAMLTRVIQDLGFDDKRYPAREVASQINRAKQEVVTADAFDDGGNPWLEIVRRIYREYEARMARAGALDFGDLIYRMVRAVEGDEELRRELSGRFQHLLVDEFQDTNHAQYRLVRALSATHRNLCVVGDDDQSIYRWRGADRRNILNFREEFPDAVVVKLEQNYRSTKRILRAAHTVIKPNLEREPKRLWTDNEDGARVIVVRNGDERDEAMTLVRKVRAALTADRSLEDIAVFYRTHAQSRVLEEALRAANVPYRVVGGTRFYDRAEVKDALAYLRVLHNPDDDVSLLRIINTPPRGIGKTTIERLLNHAAGRGSGVWAALTEVDQIDSIKAAAAKRVGEFRGLIEELRGHVGRISLFELGEEVLEMSGYAPLLKEQGTVEATGRLENLRELLGSMREVDESAEAPTLASFLELVTLQTSADEGQEGARLTLMTVHAAKGLEFPVVFVCGLEDGMFPLRGTEAHEDPLELEEERRLAYVAFTRAEEELILTFAGERRIYGQLKMNRPSQFLLSLPQEDITTEGGPAVAAVPSGRRVGMVGPKLGWRQEPYRPSRPLVSHVPDGTGIAESYVDTSEGDFSGDEEGVRIGMRVRHKKFGVGEVRSLPAGMPPRIRVQFPGWGEKTLVAEFLEPA